MNAKRGFVPEDEKNFSTSALETLRTASRQIFYLINEGYDLKQASVFVGNHFLLSERQRLAIVRSLATKDHLKNRLEKEKTGFRPIPSCWITVKAGTIFRQDARKSRGCSRFAYGSINRE